MLIPIRQFNSACAIRMMMPRAWSVARSEVTRT